MKLTDDTSGTMALKVLRDRVTNALRSGQGPGARILRGSSLAAIVNVAGLPVSFVTQIVLARSMGANDYGIYAFALSVVNILAIYSTLGLENVSLRFVSTFAGAEDWAGVRGFARFGYRATLLASLVLLIAGGLYIEFWPSATRLAPPALIALILLLPVTAIMVLQSCMLQVPGAYLRRRSLPLSYGR